MEMYLWIDVMDCRFKAAECWVLIKPNFLAKLREIYHYLFGWTSEKVTDGFPQDLNKTLAVGDPDSLMSVL